jgi:hypothetical protein
MKDMSFIGFRFKGVRHFFRVHQQKYDLLEGDFISLVSVLEDALQKLGDEVFKNTERKAAYL